MPFAKKFRAMMDFPFAGDRVGDFVVESVDVRDVHGGAEGYHYDVHMVLHGPGGKAGVRKTLKSFFAQHPTTFSGYGNPYQLWFNRPEVESLGDKRYAVSVQGAGVRIHLEQDLERFLAYLVEQGLPAEPQDEDERAALIESYLDDYRAEIKRRVGRYRSKLRRAEAGESQ